MPLRYELLAGNKADGTPVQDVVIEAAARYTAYMPRIDAEHAFDIQRGARSLCSGPSMSLVLVDLLVRQAVDALRHVAGEEQRPVRGLGDVARAAENFLAVGGQGADDHL